MNTDLAIARAEAIREVTADMLQAAGLALQRHGKDPHSRIILTCAVTMLIDEIDRKLVPGFRDEMRAMLRGARS